MEIVASLCRALAEIIVPGREKIRMTAAPLVPPIAAVVPHTTVSLGRTLVDNYAWLQNKDDPQVIAYLEAENTYASALLAPTEALQEQLFEEMRGRIQEDDASAPVRHGSYRYYWRMEPGKQYRIFCRRDLAEDAAEEILLDENRLAEGQSYCAVGPYQPSPDHSLLAYGVDTTGALIFDLYVKDLATGAILSGPIPRGAYSIAWAADSRTLFYTVFDDAHRPYKLYRHRVGQDPERDVLVCHEPDDAYNLWVRTTRSRAYVLLTSASHSTSEVRYLHAGEPEGEFRVMEPRRPWVEYYAEHAGGQFLIHTNEDAENFRLMAAPVRSPGRGSWREIIPHRGDTLIENVHAFGDHVAVLERQGGLQCIRLSAPDGLSNVRYVPFPEPVYTVALESRNQELNPEYDTNLLRFEYSSLVTPNSTVDYDMDTGAWTVVKRQVIPSGYDPSQYNSERLFAVTPDSSQAPISLVYRKGLQKDGSAPLLLYGYGSYGYSTEPGFDIRRLSLLDRGFIYAIAHVRGGSELGRAWYEQGRLLHKRNTFTDFIACAEHLVSEGYTSPERLAMMGGSAGGLLVSAVANMRPDLFKAVIAMVPFTNIVTAMLMPELPLTVPEWEQWGNPADEAAFDYMLSYSPYDNVARQAYPHIYVKAGLNDLQVPYWDPAKWVAKLRCMKTDANRLALVTIMSAGHSGPSGRYNSLREMAQAFAFLIDTVTPLS
jgi:oligopeptidase B